MSEVEDARRERKRRWKRLKRRFAFLLLWFTLSPLGWLPERLAFAVGAALGSLAYALAFRSRALAVAQLQEALGLDVTGARRVARSMGRHLGWMIAELLLLSRDRARLLAWVRLDEAALGVLERVTQAGRGGIAVSAHLGNWELLPQRVAAAGYPVLAAARENPNPALDRWVVEQRALGGVRTIQRGDTVGFLEVRRILRSKTFLAVLIDQRTRVPSIAVPFFGRPAETPRTAAELALKLKVPLLGVFIVREGPGRHRVEIEEVATPESGPDLEAAAARLTAELTAMIERKIRAAPEQWVWFHRRWRA